MIISRPQPNHQTMAVVHRCKAQIGELAKSTLVVDSTACWRRQLRLIRVRPKQRQSAVMHAPADITKVSFVNNLDFLLAGLGALLRCDSLVWRATPRSSRLASHPNPTAKSPSYFLTSPKAQRHR